MTTNEQIMIDGVDVSGCEDLKLDPKEEGVYLCSYREQLAPPPFCVCKYFPYCNYKESQRNLQAEQKKEALNIIVNEKEESYRVTKLNAECSRYKQALDEIEKIVTLDKTHIKYAGSTLVICDDILDIIRKAKGEE